MSGAVASLGMYDHPAQQAANDQLWTALATRLRARGIDAPDRLDRMRTVEAIWRDPKLLFGQTCGYPLVTDAALALHVIGIPAYDAPDCAHGRHVSYLVARRADDGPLATFRNRRAAINAPNSNTGYNLFRATVAPLAQDGRFFGDVVETGSHRASVEAVGAGAADIAAIDAVSFAALRRFDPDAVSGLRVIGVTADTPALPFVTARSTPEETIVALREALADVIADPALVEARAKVFLADVIPSGPETYARVRALECAAVEAGYPILR